MALVRDPREDKSLTNIPASVGLIVVSLGIGWLLLKQARAKWNIWPHEIKQQE
ncbi:MAG: hypothetical protein ACAI35_18235 [Candidatus Methylacidiphilales bacterium]|nr:hypothetical protein [Candidatus Methylacidiphilales bacterium]